MYEETRCVDRAICPKCNSKFDPDKQKSSTTPNDYEVKCPSCGANLTVFESIEYFTRMTDEDDL